jgi:hypothetical protein
MFFARIGPSFGRTLRVPVLGTTSHQGATWEVYMAIRNGTCGGRRERDGLRPSTHACAVRFIARYPLFTCTTSATICRTPASLTVTDRSRRRLNARGKAPVYPLKPTNPPLQNPVRKPHLPTSASCSRSKCHSPPNLVVGQRQNPHHEGDYTGLGRRNRSRGADLWGGTRQREAGRLDRGSKTLR